MKNTEVEEITLPKIDTDILSKLEDEKQIVVFNDDVNTFENVITTLIDYCNHSSVQAEQCAYIIHHKGKCSVKKGTYKDLKPICSAILERGINAEIQ